MTDRNIFPQIAQKIPVYIRSKFTKTFDFFTTRYPTKIPDLLGTRIRLFEIPTRPDPNPTFYYPIYLIPDFLLPVPALHDDTFGNSNVLLF